MITKAVSFCRFPCLVLMLFSFMLPVNAGIYVFTETGRMARSTDDGASWSWLTTTLPVANPADMTSDAYHYLYVVSRTGEVYRSVNYGSTWESRGNISVSDASAIWVITGMILVVTESGDFYQRLNSSGSWSLLGNIGAMDFVDIAPHPTSGFLVFTRSGDVWQVQTSPFSKSLLGNVGSSAIAGAATLTNAVIAATDQGDAARSTNGASWSWVGAVSQVTITGIASKGANLYATTNAGEVVRSTNQGTNWLWRGNVSQMGTIGITSDSVGVIGVEEDSVHSLEILGVYPNPSHGLFTIRFLSDFNGNGMMRLFDVLGRESEVLWQGAIMDGFNARMTTSQLRGVHFLVIESDRVRAVRKIVIE